MRKDLNMYPNEYDGYRIPEGIKQETKETKEQRKEAEAKLAQLSAQILAKHGK